MSNWNKLIIIIQLINKEYPINLNEDNWVLMFAWNGNCKKLQH